MSKENTMKVVTTLGACLATICCCLAVPAIAAATPAPSPAWTVSSRAEPTNFAAGSTYSSSMDQYQVTVTNTGGAPSDGSPIVVSDELPAGVTLDTAGASGSDPPYYNTVSCVQSTSDTQNVTCTDSDSTPLQSDASLTIKIPVDVDSSASGPVTNAVTVSGGDGTALAVSTSETTPISSTPAPFGLQAASVRSLNADGSPDTQAGSHPYQVMTSMVFNTVFDSDGALVPSGNLETATLDLPPGLVGAATATPTCDEQAMDGVNAPGCPTDTQVGVAYLTVASATPVSFEVPVYNMTPTADEPAEFAFKIITSIERINWSVRSGSDYGLTATLSAVNTATPLYNATVDLWGDPADSSHDTQRFTPEGGVNGTPGDASGNPLPDGAPALPLITNPTECGSTMPVQISATSWQNPNQPVTEGSVSATNGQPLTGCGSLPFDPSLSAQPSTSVADSPSGLDVDLSVPQNENVTGLAEADLKTISVSLPSGVTIDPSAGTGLTGCSPSQIGLDNADAPSCPDSSKIGTVAITTPLISDKLTGAIYVAQQTNNPFGSLLAIYVTAYADGVWVKLAGEVQADPVTGQLVTTVSNNPQLPFNDLNLEFFSGSRGIIATPQACGTYTTSADLTPWSDPSGASDVTPTDSFNTTSGCVSGFAPTFTAGSQNAQAGAYSPLVLSLGRTDADQNLSGLSVTLPEGLLANLSKVQECSETALASISSAAGTAAAQAASPSCPSSSQVGTVTVGSGTGPDPFQITGQVYLTGPYDGGPYGLAIVVPVLAGPYDLGTVVVRQALRIDPNTLKVTDVSDTFPTIVHGIPLDIRQVSVDLNRPGFTVNPTSCDPTSIVGSFSSTSGTASSSTSRFQVGGCQELGYDPKLSVDLTGNGETRSGDHPKLVATLTVPSGDANTESIGVTLPLAIALDPDNSQIVCPWANVKNITTGAANCPAATEVGDATAHTPLLSEPLTGTVYLVQGIKTRADGSIEHTLPKLLVTLRGQIDLNLWAQTSVNGAGALVTTFPTIPDAAVSKFTLNINGGSKGILVVTGLGQNICTAKQQTQVVAVAQSAKKSTVTKGVATPCIPTKKIAGNKTIVYGPGKPKAVSGYKLHGLGSGYWEYVSTTKTKKHTTTKKHTKKHGTRSTVDRTTVRQ